MLLEDRESRARSHRKKKRMSTRKRVLMTVSVIAVAAAVGAGVLLSTNSSGPPASAATKLPVQPTQSAAPAPPAPPQTWQLKFDSAFTGTQLDTSMWGTCYPWAPNGCTNYGNTSDPDQEWYQASQDLVSGGVLRLVAQPEPTAGLAQNGSAKEYQCRSGMVTTYPSLQFKYGFVQVVAKIPFGPGLWPALWLAAANQKWPPEVDMLEHWSSDADGKVYFHPVTGPRQGGPVSMPNLATGWHTFTLSWTSTGLTWYYDGTQVFASSTDVPQQSMYLIANLADDSAAPGSCSGSMLIKSIKVWQPS
jgi:beta-glucanase (GH16 family)